MNQNPLPKRIRAKDARLDLCETYLTPRRADNYFDEILARTEWQQHHIRCFGRTVAVPRLTAWYGDQQADYRYSGINLTTQPWTPLLQTIKNNLETICGASFNSVLVNRYRNGKDAVGWHADDEKELGDAPVIASLSLGATRRLRMKHRYVKSEKIVLDLTHGSLLLMAGYTQKYWLHQLTKTARPVGERLNLTFRFVYS